tara:strand:+ start:1280 stop:1774 length:495 start_codon:yes stop_codon:yes gene_type:complete
MGYKMKGPSLYPNYKSNGAGAKGSIPLEKSGYKSMADGKAKSSAFQMKGDLNKDGKMSGYETARQTAIERNMKKDAPTKMKDGKKTKEDLLKEGFTPADADRMIKDGAVTGRPKAKAKPKSQEDFVPAYPGADYSKADIAKMTEKEKEMKIDGYVPKKKTTKKK